MAATRLAAWSACGPAQIVAQQVGRVQSLGRSGRGCWIGWILTCEQEFSADGAIELTGVEIVQTEGYGQSARPGCPCRRRRDHRSPTTRLTPANRRPRWFISAKKPGKLVSMKPGVIDRHWLISGKAENDTAHCQSVVHLGEDMAASRRWRARAADEQVVAIDRDSDTVGMQQRGSGGKPIALFHPELTQAAQTRGGHAHGRRRPRGWEIHRSCLGPRSPVSRLQRGWRRGR